MYCSSFLTGYGAGIVYANEKGVTGVVIPDVSQSSAASCSANIEIRPSELSVETARMLQRYFCGERIDFSRIPVVLGDLPPFRQKVLELIRMIPFGNISSYGQVAGRCGSPRASRAVGGALACNPMPVIIPCHRVVASDGRLTGFSAPGGQASKFVLLQMEGIEFKGLRVETNQLVMNRISSS